MSVNLLNFSYEKFKGLISKAFEKIFGKAAHESLQEDKRPNCGGKIGRKKE